MQERDVRVPFPERFENWEEVHLTPAGRCYSRQLGRDRFKILNVFQHLG